MLSNNDQKQQHNKELVAADSGSQSSQTQAVVEQESAAVMANWKRQHTIQEFDKLTRELRSTWLDPAQPEVSLVRLACAFTRFVLAQEDAPQAIIIQTEQLKRAFRSTSEGASLSAVVDELFREYLFPDHLKPLANDYHRSLRVEVEATEYVSRLARSAKEANPDILAGPLRTTGTARNQAAIETVCWALDTAAHKLVADLQRGGLGTVVNDEAYRSECEKFLSILKRGDEEELSKRHTFYRHLPRPIDYRAIERHFLGVVGEPGQVAVQVFEDVGSVASMLMFSGYSAEVVAPAILLHATNSLDSNDELWLNEVIQRLPDEAHAILAAARPARPDPIRAPGKVSILNCQRPLEVCTDVEPDVSRAARAIAVASALSPAYTPTIQELLTVVPFLRGADTPPILLSAIKARCLELGQLDVFSRSNQHSDVNNELKEIQGVLEQFRRLHVVPKESGEEGSFFRLLHHAGNVAFNIISEKGHLKVLSEGFIHPSFSVPDSMIFWARGKALIDRAFEGGGEEAHLMSPEKRAEGARKISDVSDNEAQQMVESISAGLIAQIREDRRALRWQSGIMTSLDFQSPSAAERYRSIVEGLGAPRSHLNTGAPSLASFVSENSERIIERVLKVYNQWLRRESHREGEVIKQIVAIVKRGGFSSTDISDAVLEFDGTMKVNDGKLRKRSRRFLNKEGSSVFQLGLWGILRRLQGELYQRPERAVLDQEATLRTICSFLRSEATRSLTRWDAPHVQKMLAMTLGHIPAQAPQELAKESLYSAGERRRFALASAMIMNTLQDVQETDTPRSRAESYKHCLEVGMVLALAGASSDVVLGGILHDLYELVARSDGNNPDKQPRLPLVRNEVRKAFGVDVDKLVDLVSEVRVIGAGTTPSFTSRKTAIFKKIEVRYRADPTLARKAVTLLLAAKVSTLNEGLALVEEMGDSRPWSKGDYLDNLGVMVATRDLSGQLCEGNVITTLFDQLIGHWCAAADSARVQTRVGMEYFWGTTHREEDPSRAMPLLFSAARAGDPEAMRLLAVGYLEGTGVPRNSTSAARLLNFIVRDPQLLDRVGWDYDGQPYWLLRRIYTSAHLDDGIDAERVELIRYLEEQAKSGSAGAEYQLGLCHLWGWGLPKTPGLALERLQRAAQLLNFVKDYLERSPRNDFTGRRPSQDEKEIFSYVYFEIGQIYERGVEGIPAEPERAFACYNTLVGDNFYLFKVQRAMHRALAVMYRDGRGTDKNEDRAKHYENLTDGRAL